METPTKRFSKATVREWAERQIAYLEEEWKFDPTNGSAQVRGKGEEANLAYGKYIALQDMLEALYL